MKATTQTVPPLGRSASGAFNETYNVIQLNCVSTRLSAIAVRIEQVQLTIHQLADHFGYPA